MRIKVNGKEMEVRVQERRIILADFLCGGKVVATSEAICNPIDKFDRREGEKIAVERAAKQLEQLGNAKRKQILEALDFQFRIAGVLKGSVELPPLATAEGITQEVLEKLDKRREKAPSPPKTYRAVDLLDAFLEGVKITRGH